MNQLRLFLRLFLLLTVCLELISTPVLAQVIQDEDDQMRNTPENQPLIAEIAISGSTIFSQMQLQSAVAQFLGKPARLGTIQEIARAIAELYWQNGYKTSDAYPLKAQELSQGIVKIRVVEGSLESIEIEGLHHVREDYVRDRLFLKAKTPLNVDALLEAVQQLQLNPLFTTVNASLTRGSSPPSSILKVSLVEAPNYRLQIGGDNYGAYSSGENQGAASFALNSLTGRGDRLSAQILVSEGSQQLIADYQIPLNPENGTLRLHYEGGNSRVIREPLERFDIEGDYQKAFVQWRQPVAKTLNREVAVGIEAGWQQSQTFVLGQEFSFFSQIPDEGYQTWTVRFSGEWRESFPTRALASSAQLTVGGDSLTATEDPYLILRGQFQWLERLNESLLLSVSLSAQVTGTSLADTGFGVLPSEQFPIGGIGTVPGYDLNFRRGDSGFNGMVKLQQTVLDSPEVGKMELVPFFAVGRVWNETVPLLPPQTLTSLGVNWQWQWHAWEASFGAAAPLVDAPSEFKREFYFSIRKRFDF